MHFRLAMSTGAPLPESPLHLQVFLPRARIACTNVYYLSLKMAVALPSTVHPIRLASRRSAPIRVAKVELAARTPYAQLQIMFPSAVVQVALEAIQILSVKVRVCSFCFLVISKIAYIFLEIPPECRSDDDCGLERICLKQKCQGLIGESCIYNLKF